MKNIQSKFELIADHGGASFNPHHIDTQSLHYESLSLSLARRTVTLVFWCLAYAVLLGAGLSLAGNAWSGELKNPAENAVPKKDYLVSAFLREGVDGFTVKLVHLIQSANNRDEAAGIFTRLAFEQYPGHAVAQTLIAEISLPPGPCAKDKQAAPETAAATFYAISAVMRKGADGPDLMLLNGWMPGNNADEALKRALQEAAVKYPNYAAIRTLVTELQVARPACSAPSPMRGHWREA